MIQRILNLFNKNKTEFICPKCGKNLYLTGQVSSNRRRYYLVCKSCNEEFTVEKW